MSRQALGDAGERLAERLLVKKGYTILERQWRVRTGEIDLVALDGDLLVFCEVKTRRGAARGAAEEAVDPAKAARLLALGEDYVEAHPEHAARFWRVDLLAITLGPDGRVARVSHIEDAIQSE
ncbi:MAG TPA: YraN family protein [Thermomicrobiaceae bacterium]|nr:YraN family protein [Thermomicrobiaceae bacterium]